MLVASFMGATHEAVLSDHVHVCRSLDVAGLVVDPFLVVSLSSFVQAGPHRPHDALRNMSLRALQARHELVVLHNISMVAHLARLMEELQNMVLLLLISLVRSLATPAVLLDIILRPFSLCQIELIVRHQVPSENFIVHTSFLGVHLCLAQGWHLRL